MIDKDSTRLFSEVVMDFCRELDQVVMVRVFSSVFKRNNICCAAVRRDAAQISEISREAWRGTMAQYRQDQLICLDEYAANEKTGWTKYGWSRRGLNPATTSSLKREKRWSILPAYTVDGFLNQDCSWFYYLGHFHRPD